MTACITSGRDVELVTTKAANGSATMTGLHANGTPFVWNSGKVVNIEDPNWLNNLIGQ